MRRREFIALLGSIVGCPIDVHAQQADKLPTIGFLGSGSRPSQGAWVEAFAQRIRELGWTEGRTVAFEYRWAEGRSNRLAEIASEFVRLKVTLIYALGTDSALAAKRATSTIPIVFPVTGDPIGPAWSRVWRDLAATPRACQTLPSIWLPSASRFCAMFFRASPIWQSSPTRPIQAGLSSWARYKRQPAHLA